MIPKVYPKLRKRSSIGLLPVLRYVTLRYVTLLYLNEGDSIVPPMIITISCDSFISGSKPRLPPGDDSNIKPKSVWVTKTRLVEIKELK